MINGLAPDIMHDILEGTLPLVVKLLLVHYISDQSLISLADLNTRIVSFKYGASVKNKPSLISTNSFTSSDSKLRQSGAFYLCSINIYLMTFTLCINFIFECTCTLYIHSFTDVVFSTFSTTDDWGPDSI